MFVSDPIIRKVDWQAHLHQYLAKWARVEFQPGEYDCALFTAGAVEAMTGVDLFSKFKPYSSVAEGMKKLRKAGYKSHVEFVERHFPEVQPAFLFPGDIAILSGDNGIDAVSIVQGTGIYSFNPESKRLGFAPLTDAKRGFRVLYEGQK